MPVRLDFRVVESTSQDDGFSHSNILEIGPQVGTTAGLDYR